MRGFLIFILAVVLVLCVLALAAPAAGAAEPAGGCEHCKARVAATACRCEGNCNCGDNCLCDIAATHPVPSVHLAGFQVMQVAFFARRRPITRFLGRPLWWIGYGWGKP